MSTKKIQILNGSFQSDWNETDETQINFIKNKPNIATDDEVMALLSTENIVTPVADASGYIYLDSDEKILTI